MYDSENVKKVCSFCVSDLHLITMLLPYLDRKLKKNESFITVLENDLKEQVKLVLSRLTLNNEDKNKLLNIKWDSKNIYNNEIIQKELIKNIKQSRNINIIINGTKEYIEQANEKLNTILEDSEKGFEIRIINCYDITKLDDDIKDILKTHDIILNTSGEKEISEVFEGYEKRKGA